MNGFERYAELLQRERAQPPPLPGQSVFDIPPNAKVGERYVFGQAVVEILDEHTAVVVEDGDV